MTTRTQRQRPSPLDGARVRPRPTRRQRLVALLLSTLAGLALAELGAGWCRGDAYPFLNVFIADEDFGVALEPGAETALRSREGRVTDVRVNRQGFRGGDWPSAAAAPIAGRVLLVGDSQVFGFGVDEADGMASRLEALAHARGESREVLNAGVPTWGPAEAALSVERLAPTYRPETVVFVLNAANDWLESNVPNVKRTTARDGWARHVVMGRDGAPEPEPVAFPGRRWLMGRSHLVLMVRQLMAAGREQAPHLATSIDRLVDELDVLLRPSHGHRSRMTRHVLRAVRACEPLGCRVVVAGLPLDVQVHSGEWAKYRQEPRDDAGFHATRTLMRDALAEARSHGLTAVPLAPVLAAASPGAFLPDDYHLSPVGHDAVAHALDAFLTPRVVPAPPRSASAQPTGPGGLSR